MEVSPVDDKSLRRAITDKWGVYSFLSAILALLVVALANTLLAPKLYSTYNTAPVTGRTKLKNLPWVNIGMLSWTGLIIWMAFVQTYGDLIWFAKRTGRLAVTLMPAMYLLTLRPSPLPHTFYLQVLPMHKWLSRLVVIMAVAHGISYAHYYRANDMLDKLRKPENIAGYLVLLMFLIAAMTAFSWFRRQAYRVFYFLHICTAWGSLPLIWYHSRPPCSNYLLVCFGMLLAQVVFRILRSCSVRLRVQAVSKTLLIVDIPKCQLPRHFQRWSPGAHVRLSLPLTQLSTWFQASHPYTISSLDSQNSLQMIIRKGNFPVKMRQPYNLSGPHRAVPYYFDKQLKENKIRRCLLVIGGSGIAFGAPILRYLRLYGVQVRMLWSTRDPYDAKALPALKLHEDMLAGRVEIYYTGEAISEDSDEFEDEGLEVVTSDNCCQEEPDERTPLTQADRKFRKALHSDDLLSNYNDNMYNARCHLNLRLKSWLYGLSPDNDDCCCADRLIDASDEDKLGVWVISTGHPKLVQDAKAWANRAGVNFFEEEFTL